MPAQPVIKLDEIHKTYHTGEVDVHAVRGVSLQILPGEFVAIMGSSGSGKSTLMNMVGALDHPTGGHYWLDGIDVSTLDRDALATALGQLPGVAGVRVLPSDEALGRMRAELGTRAALLDGVEDGFLPTTLEIALRPGAQGAGRADELAWRLRRMAGISDVDVLRNEADHRLVTEQETSRRLRFTLLAIGGLLALAALMFVAAVGRRRRADALILDGLGFTPLAVYGPAFAGGALAAAAGTALALLGLRLLERLAPVLSSVAPIFALPHGLPTGRAQAAAFVVATSFGGALAWWGMRLPRRSSRGDGLAPGP